MSSEKILAEEPQNDMWWQPLEPHFCWPPQPGVAAYLWIWENWELMWREWHWTTIVSKTEGEGGSSKVGKVNGQDRKICSHEDGIGNESQRMFESGSDSGRWITFSYSFHAVYSCIPYEYLQMDASRSSTLFVKENTAKTFGRKRPVLRLMRLLFVLGVFTPHAHKCLISNWFRTCIKPPQQMKS